MIGWRRRLRRVSVGSVGVLLVVLTGCTTTALKPIPEPPTGAAYTTAPAPTDLSGVAVAAVSGKSTTTKVAIAPGPATLSGQVLGPDGPVAGATVRLERLVGDASATLDVLTAADGTWSAPPPPPPPPTTAPLAPGETVPVTPPTQATTTTRALGPTGILGGRYRVRAWRSPDLALTAPTLLFLGGAEKKVVPLQVARYTGLSVTSGLAPNPPVVEQPMNLAVLVTTRSVDGNGVVRAVGVPATPLTLLTGGGWTLVRDAAETDGNGRALYQLRCRGAGSQTLGVTVGGTQTFTLAVPACVDPPPVTTTPVTDPGLTTTSSSVPDESTTTTRRATTTTRPATTTTT